MRIALLFAMFVLMATEVFAQQALTPPAAVTDPKKIESKIVPDMQTFTIEQLYMTRVVGATAWSPDGKQIAVVTNISGRNNIWLVPASGGWPTQLTISDQRQMSPAWSPDGKYIVYQSDYDGNEQYDLFLVSPLNGEVTNITNTPDVSEEDAAWSPDGKLLAYVSRPKTSANYEIMLMEMLTRRSKALTKNTPKELSNAQPIWSKDGKYIAYTQENADERDTNILILEVATGKTTKLTEHQGEHTFRAQDWSPDGKKILITSNAGNGYDNVGLLYIASKQIEWLTQEKWEIAAGHFSPDGKLITWTANLDGNTDIFVYEVATKKAEPLAVKKGLNSLGGAESEFSRDGSRLLFYHNGADAPNDVWVYGLGDKSAQQITYAFAGGLRSQDMVEPFLVHYPSKDEKFTLSAFVYIPHNAPRDGTHPVIMYVHGGPTAQSVNSFNRMLQYLANAGYLVMAPNYRGSTGYGREFMDANRYDMGGSDLEDVVAGVDWIEKSGYVDPKKVVIMGGSYGGYLTMMGVTKHPELWAAGVAIVPFVNWFTEIANEDPTLREYDLLTMGDPVKDKARLEERSPIFFVDKIKAPVLLLAGGNDPRCPRTETTQVVEAIKKQGGVADSKIYENEGHGFARVENQIDAYTRVANFLKKYVPAPECGCTL